LHWRPSAKVNWQRLDFNLSEGLFAGASEWRCGLSWEITDLKKEAGLGPMGGSFAVVICNITIEVSRSKWIVYRIDY
jgi:hypothetical protein